MGVGHERNLKEGTWEWLEQGKGRHKVIYSTFYLKCMKL